MKKLLTGWDWMRIIRLLLGVGVIVQGINNEGALYFVVGAILVWMALANTGCSGTRGCAVNPRKVNSQEEKEIVYEEVDATK